MDPISSSQGTPSSESPIHSQSSTGKKVNKNVRFFEAYDALNRHAINRHNLRNTCRLYNIDPLGSPINSLGRSILLQSIVDGRMELAKGLMSELYISCSSSLQYAVQFGRVELIPMHFPRSLLPGVKGFDPTALHFAAAYGQKEALDILLDKGAHINASCVWRSGVSDSITFSGMTPIALAVIKGHLNCVQTLLETHNAHTEVKDFGTLFHLAIHFNQFDILKHLCEQSSDILTELQKLDPQQRTPIMLAQEFGDRRAVSYLSNLLKTKNKIETEPLIEQQNDTQGTSILPPKTLVIQGGSLFRLSDVVEMVRYFEQQSFMGKIENISGTSIGGALVATLLALGYTSEEIEKDVHVRSLFDALAISQQIKPDTKFYDRFKQLSGGSENLDDIEPSRIPALISAFFAVPGHVSSKKLQALVEELIKKKTGISNCTFGQLRDLRDEGSAFKHLYFAVASDKYGPLASNVSSYDESCDDVVISDSVIACMSIPGLFQKIKIRENTSHLFYIQNKFFGCGLFQPNPLEDFDWIWFLNVNKTLPIGGTCHAYNRTTLGFFLSSPRQETSISNLSIAELYSAVEEMLCKQNWDERMRLATIEDQTIQVQELSPMSEENLAL